MDTTIPENSEHIRNGQAALAKADWESARACFEQALQVEDSPQAHDGLGIALWWLNDIHASHRQRIQAFNGYKERGAVQKAARIAAWIAREQVFLSSNFNAMQGWFGRAGRLLDGAPPCAEHGWLDLFRASMLAPAAELEQASANALALAGQFHDPDLEAYAIAFGGMAQVSLGKVAPGMAALDEAMAAAYSGGLDYMTISEIFCLMLSACELTGDLAQTEHWCKAAAEYAREHRCPFLSAYCRTTYGSLLTSFGRWQEADRALTEAIDIFSAGHQGLKVHAVIRLADLRIYQGRFEEAEALLAGYEDQNEAALPMARLYLARRQTGLARAVLESALGTGTPATLDQAPLLRLLVDVHLADSNVASASRAVDALNNLAGQTESDLLYAQASLAQGQVRRYQGDEGALADYEAALVRLKTHEESLLAGRARLEMARLVQEKDPPAAITWARAALASFDRIGAVHDADEAAQLLRSMGAARIHAAHAAGALSQREAEVYNLLKAGLTNREISERLFLSPKTVEHHVPSILGKLGLRSRAEALALALKGTPSETEHGTGG